MASTPARAKRLAPSPDSPLTHFASPRGEKSRLARERGCGNGRWYNPGMFRLSLSFLALLSVVSLAALPLAGADWERLGRVQKVYLWPMSDSLDQFLAEQVATEGVFDVVVDPKRAQAILTDRISSKFLEGMEELFPTPEEIAEAEPRKKKRKKLTIQGQFPRGPIASERSPIYSASRAEGAVFLVDVRTREVLWSTFLKGYDTTPKAMHRQARMVVMRLKKQLAGSSF